MRLFGGRLINSGVRRQIDSRMELRDAIVFDIDYNNKYCRVKIQGSDVYIRAYYNENWSSTPEWLKPGNAVRISHPQGNKGRIEVVGHGILIPTAIPGGNVTPPAPSVADAILSGLSIYAGGYGMYVTVATGSYRIGGIVYALGAMTMDRTDIVMDRPDITMDGTAENITFDAADSSQFRYDLIVVGTDGIAHAVKGTNAISDPVMPSVPADHLQIDWVFIPPGLTAITQGEINRTYSIPVISEFRCVISDTDLAWGESSSTITISMRDQYGRIIYGAYSATLTIQAGNGTLTYENSSSTSSLVVNFSGSADINYTRGGLNPGDFSPIITINESTTGMAAAAYVMLRDSDGNVMVG